MASGHGITASFERRPLTEQERAWIAEILAANKDWADVTVGELFATGGCSCGCRTISLEAPPTPQNPRMAGRGGLVGTIDIMTKGGHAITVLLHHNEGSLTELEVIWYEFPAPVPENWEEVSHVVSAG